MKAKYCIKCGNQVPEGAEFCPACGEKIVNIAASAPIPSEESKSPEESREQVVLKEEILAQTESRTENPSHQSVPSSIGASTQTSSVMENSSVQVDTISMETLPQNDSRSQESFVKEESNSAIGSDVVYANPSAAGQAVEGQNSFKSKNCKIIIFAIVVLFLLLILAGIIGSIFSEPEYVASIRGAYFQKLSTTITVGEAFEERFKEGKWSQSQNINNNDLMDVYFTGIDKKSEKYWICYFTYQIPTDNFSLTMVQVDEDQFTDNANVSYLLEYVYTGDLAKLEHKQLANAWFSDPQGFLEGAIWSALGQ